jgi:cytochrome P450
MTHADFRYDPFSIEAMTRPLDFYPTLREHFPAYYMPDYDAWAISRFADVWDGFLDSTNFTEAEGQIFGREQLLRHNEGIVPSADQGPFVFNNLDAVLHTRFRQAMNPALLKSSVDKLEPHISALVANRLDTLLARGGFDLNGDFASHVAAGTAAGLVGLGDADVSQIVTLVNVSIARAPGQSGFTAAGERALGELIGMLMGVVAARRVGQGVETLLIDALIRADLEGRRLTDLEIAQNLVSILIGGIETLPKIVSGGMLALARLPDQLSAVAADPDRHAPLAFEEMLRFNAPAQWFGRTVKHGRALGSAQLQPGQRVLLLIAAANRDPREFTDPGAFVWNRKIRRMLSFGIGPHFCIGIHLARLEGQIMIRELLRRMPRFDVDEAAGFWSTSEFQVGWTSLPVRLAA